MSFQFSGLTGQELPLQTNVYDIPIAVTSSDRNSKISVNKNPAYQDIHSIQTDTPVYDSVIIILIINKGHR